MALPRSCNSVCSNSIGAQMPGATNAKGSTSTGAIQSSATNSAPAPITTPRTVTGAISAWARAIAATNGRVKSAKAAAKPSTASR